MCYIKKKRTVEVGSLGSQARITWGSSHSRQKKMVCAWCDRVGVGIGIGRIVGWMGISEGSGVIRGDSKNRNEKRKKRVVGSSQGAPLALALTPTLVRPHFSFPALWASLLLRPSGPTSPPTLFPLFTHIHNFLHLFHSFFFIMF